MMKFIEVINKQDRDLLKELGFVQLNTFDNGYDMKKYIFLVSSEVEQDKLCNIGLTHYCITNHLTF